MRENGVKTYFASDIAYHLNKRERGFEQLIDVLGADHHGYIARVRAGLVAMGQPARLPRGAADAVRHAVSRRREGADVHALRRVRHAARAAPRGRQRRRALLLRDAQQRAAPRLRHGAGEVALATRIPVYYIQYAHARVCSVLRQLREKGFAAGRGARAAQRCARLVEPHEQALLASLEPLSGSRRARPRCSARRTRWCTTCASSRPTSTPTTTPTSSSSTTRALRDARLTLILGLRQVMRNGLGAARRLGAGGDVMAGQLARGRTLSRDFKHVRAHSPVLPAAVQRLGGALRSGSSIGLAVALAVFLHYRNQCRGTGRRCPCRAASASATATDESRSAGDRRRHRRLRLLRHAAEAGSRSAATSAPAPARRRPGQQLPSGDVVLQAGSFKQPGRPRRCSRQARADTASSRRSSASRWRTRPGTACGSVRSRRSRNSRRSAPSSPRRRSKRRPSRPSSRRRLP